MISSSARKRPRFYRLQWRGAPTPFLITGYGRSVKTRAEGLTVNFLPVIPSPGSCQVLCVSIDAATVLRIMTPHDREGPAAWSSARHERAILCTEDEKEQK